MHRIATLRRLVGLSQRQLATKSGVSPGRIAEAESGTRPLTPEAALKMAPHLKEDPIRLYLDTTVAALKAGIGDGSTPPVRAAYVARALIEIIESGNLSAQQVAAARNAARELVSLATAAAEKSGAGTLSSIVRGSGGQGPASPPQRSSEPTQHQEMMEHLGRDSRGRLLAEDVTEKALGKSPEGHKRPKSQAPTDADLLPGLDHSSSYKSTYDDLGRDSFGRKKKNP